MYMYSSKFLCKLRKPSTEAGKVHTAALCAVVTSLFTYLPTCLVGLFL